MSKVRQILKLSSKGIGKKKIAQRLGISRNTVKMYLKLFYDLKQPMEALLRLSDHELDEQFHPPRESFSSVKMEQLHCFFPELERQLRRRGMTLKRQYQEYKLKHPDGYGHTSFYEYYSKWSKRVKPTMHIEHKVGDKMYVDYAGATLPYVDPDTGEIKKAQVFVAILGWSQFAYVEAMRSQSVEEFIAGSENALHHFQGAPLAIVPDNLKSAVFKAQRYEPELNVNFKSFADHYAMSILPARVKRPQDKAHVENMVKIAYQRIYAELPERVILSFDELNAQIKRLLAIHNDITLTGMESSRKERWLLELASLQPLATSSFELRTIKQVTVQKNSHVHLHEDHHYYSVPYEYIKSKVKLQYTRSMVEIYHNYKLIARHKRIRSPHNYTTEPSHLPSQHRYITEWNPTFFLEKARAIHPVVEHYIAEVLNRKQHPEQTYRSCQGILSLGIRVGNDRLINACKRAHEIGYYGYKMIDDILKKNLDRFEEDTLVESMPQHSNIRGSEYYQ